MVNNIWFRIKNYFTKLIKGKEDNELLLENTKINCNFCTIGSKKYLVKLIALYNSLLKSGCTFHLWVLSMDDFTNKVLTDMKLERLHIIEIKILEEDNEILKAKEGKAENEYCWMLKAPLIEYVLLQNEVDTVMYVDSDIYFLKDPSQLFAHFEINSIYLSLQHDTEEIERKYGTYQAGLVGFKKDREGLEALRYWKAKCLEWCRHEYDPEGQRYGDQKYLDEIPERFMLVKCEENFGVNAAPWNCVYNKERTVVIENDTPYVNEDEIILFHFACITMFNKTEFDLWNMDRLEIPKYILGKLYIPYLKELMAAARAIMMVAYDVEYDIFSNKNPNEAKTYFAYDEFSDELMKYGNFYHICSIASKEYFIRVLALYRSLLQHQVNFNLWICAIDDETYKALLKLKLDHATIIHVKTVDTAARAKHNTKEYCWILKSVFIEYLFNNYKLEKVLYCDADMYFYSSVKYIYDEWGTYSFYVTTQRADKYEEQRDGQYQAGLLGFKNDSYGRKILSWWKRKCLNWCFDWHDEIQGRWGDQRYLDRVPILFENIKVSHNLGINVAPWNLLLNEQGYFVTGDYLHTYINNYVICCYHFGSMKVIGAEKFDLWHWRELNIKPEIIELLYYPYIKMLNQIMNEIVWEGIDIRKFICSDCEISSKNLYTLEEVVK